MPTILQVLPAELLGMDMARVVQGLQTVGYVLLGLVGLVMAVWVYFWPYSEYFAVERNLPGPPRSHWFFGNIHEILNSPPMSQYCSWLRTYGGVVQYRILFNLPRITLSDLSAVSYLLNHPELFPKPAQSRQALSALIGEGLILVEGATHKRQRRILNPSFNLQVTKDVLSIFWEKGYELKDKLAALIADDRDNEAGPTPPKKEDVLAYASPRGDGAVGGQGRKVDVLKFVSMASIDIIGLAGFDYDFKALSEPMNELSEAFKVLFNSAESMGFKAILQAIVPFADRLPTKRMKSIWENQAITRRIGMRLVESKKQAILAAQGGHIEKSADIGRDLLSICIKANMAADLKPEQKLTDDEVLAQITTFMLAGQETTSTGITSVLYLLALHPAAQAKLREEVMTVTDDRPGYDELTTLPYLDAVIRETLRLFPPAPATTRIAAEDVELPLSVPIKGKDGKMMDTVKLGKGANILLPIMAVNHSTEVWGPDATHFVPERHMQSIPEGAKGLASGASTSVPGVWGNNLTFLGGTRNCIGYKFALAEMKALLFVLLREFAFEQLPSKPRIEMKAAIVMRSRVVGEASAGHQMPLLVRSLAQE